VTSSVDYQVRIHRSLLGTAYRIIDALAITAGAWVALRYTTDAAGPDLIAISTTTIVAHWIASEVSGLYRNWRGSQLRLELWCMLLNWIYAAPLVLGVGMLTRLNVHISYESKVIWLLVTPLAMGACRVVFLMMLKNLRKRGFNTKRFAICGVNKLALQLAENIQSSPELGLQLAGFFDDRPSSRTKEALGRDLPCAGTLNQLADLARRGQVDMVFITFPMRAEKRIRDYLSKLSDTTASVYIVPDFFVFQMLHARWNQINGLPVVSVFETPITGIDGVLKRGFDLVVSLTLLTVLAIPLAVIAILVKTSSPGPVFFRQKRYGLMGEEIRVWKFRSMSVCDDGSNIQQATKEDDRITPIGKILRKTSIDELPQLFNVVQGSMSLVGPRPHASAHNEQYRSLIDGYMLRHKVKPGITGLAQVNGWRGETETLEKMERRIEFDHRYIREWTLWMDLKILFQTAFVVFKHENAY
jgi:putative colanic acid biosynthesis UDP-glucose lipid carrier transferase